MQQKELTWLRMLLMELKAKKHQSTILFGKNCVVKF